MLCSLGAYTAYGQKAVGDTLTFTVLSGGSVSVPAEDAWRFVSLTYNQGGYGMRTTYEGPDTLGGNYTWIAPMWNVEAQLLGDGKTDGMYILKVIKLK